MSSFPSSPSPLSCTKTPTQSPASNTGAVPNSCVIIQLSDSAGFALGVKTALAVPSGHIRPFVGRPAGPVPSVVPKGS